jgi:putative glutamine amidotransferase
MKPLILISPDFHSKGVEFADASLSLSMNYTRAIEACGGLPLAMAHTVSKAQVAEYVRRSDGVLLTGGDDLNPSLYAGRITKALKTTVTQTADGGRRDLFELLLVDEVFRQRKPLLAVCRGHQLLNVALGGTLFVDLPTQKPSRVTHRQMNQSREKVHSVRLTRGSLLSKIARNHTLGVNSTHHQAVNRVAPALRVTARSPDGVVEGMEQKSGNHMLPFLLSVQFHPERLMDRYPEHRAIFEAFIQACIAERL